MVNAALRTLGRPGDPRSLNRSAVANYRTARKTIDAATAAGLSVRDYIDLNFSPNREQRVRQSRRCWTSPSSSRPRPGVRDQGQGMGLFLEMVSEVLQPKAL